MRFKQTKAYTTARHKNTYVQFYTGGRDIFNY